MSPRKINPQQLSLAALDPEARHAAYSGVRVPPKPSEQLQHHIGSRAHSDAAYAAACADPVKVSRRKRQILVWLTSRWASGPEGNIVWCKPAGKWGGGSFHKLVVELFNDGLVDGEERPDATGRLVWYYTAKPNWPRLVFGGEEEVVDASNNQC